MCLETANECFTVFEDPPELPEADKLVVSERTPVEVDLEPSAFVTSVVKGTVIVLSLAVAAALEADVADDEVASSPDEAFDAVPAAEVPADEPAVLEEEACCVVAGCPCC